MSARKPLEPGCIGGILCPVSGHVRKGESRWASRFYHIPLTQGQKRTLRELARTKREEQK